MHQRWLKQPADFGHFEPNTDRGDNGSYLVISSCVRPHGGTAGCCGQREHLWENDSTTSNRPKRAVIDAAAAVVDYCEVCLRVRVSAEWTRTLLRELRRQGGRIIYTPLSQGLKYNFQGGVNCSALRVPHFVPGAPVHLLGPPFNSGLSNYQSLTECIKHDFMLFFFNFVNFVKAFNIVD